MKSGKNRLSVVVALVIAVSTMGISSAFASGIAHASGASWGSAVSVDESSNDPVISSLSCVSSSWCMGANLTGQYFTFNGKTWSTPTLADSNGIQALSCTTSSFCAEADQLGEVSTYNGTSWSTPVLLDGSGPSGNSSVVINSVSCAAGTSDTICWAVDANGNAFSYDANTNKWSSADGIASMSNNNLGWVSTPALTGVSCASTTFCVAVDNGVNGTANEGDAYIWNGTTWSAPNPIDFSNNTGWQLAAVSCTSSSFCMAVDNNGQALTYNGSTWSSPQLIVSDQSPLDAVSCSSTTLCAVGVNAANSDPMLGAVVTYTNGTWGTPQVIDTASSAGDRDFVSVSCPTTSFCVAGDRFGDVYYYGTPGGSSGGSPISSATWSVANSVDANAYNPIIESISCPSSSYCMAVDASGQYFTFNGTSWTSPTQFDTQINGNGNYVASVSCVSTTFCVAVDSAGYGQSYDGSSWTTPTLLDGSGNGPNLTGQVLISSVSCVSTTFCVAVDMSGNAFTFNGTSWSTADPVAGSSNPPVQLFSVSCVSTSFCMASAGNNGAVYTFDGSTWTSSSSFTTNRIDSLSCTSTTFCMAVDSSGNAGSFNGASWGGGKQIATDVVPITDVSCVGSSFCVASVNDGNGSVGQGSVVMYQNGTWQVPQVIEASPIANGNDITAVSCVSSTFCVAGDAVGNVFIYGTPSAPPATAGYWMLDEGGDVFNFGSAKNYGSALDFGAPAAALAATPSGQGYWVASVVGQVDAFGNAVNYSPNGELTSLVTSPVVAIVSTSDGLGYWVATQGGQVFAAGDAKDYGSPAESNLTLAKGIVAMTATSDGKGYWLLGGDGGVFSYGDASFFGSSGQINPGQAAGGSNSFVPNKPIQGIVATAGGKGYWMVGADGGVFAFGNAGFVGSSGQINPGQPAGGSNSFNPAKPIIGMVATSTGKGYWMVGADGGVFAFGDAGFVGACPTPGSGCQTLSSPIIGFTPV